MRDYRRKEVKGLLMDAHTMKAYPSMVTVQMISDKIGESLSLGAGQWLISIPLESVNDIIKVVEK